MVHCVINLYILRLYILQETAAYK